MCAQLVIYIIFVLNFYKDDSTIVLIICMILRMDDILDMLSCSPAVKEKFRNEKVSYCIRTVLFFSRETH